MSDRHEPTISALPSEPEEHTGSRPRSQQTPPPRRPAPSGKRSGSGGRGLAVVALFVALAGLAFAGYVYQQLQSAQDQLALSAGNLVLAERRIADLEGRLRLADNESTQSLTVLQANVKENASEIRKLWGVSNDRNRKSIEQLRADAEKTQKALASLDGNLKKQVGEMTGELKVLAELMDGQQAVIARADSAVAGQTQTLNALNQKLDALDGDLRKRVASTEEAIKAVDAFRLQINRELLELKSR